MKQGTLRSLALLLACLCGLAAARAGSFNWTGATNANWDTAGNWTLTGGSDADGIPDADDDVTFPQTGVYTSGVSLNGADRAANSLTYATTTAFTLAGVGNTLAVTSGSVTRQDVTGAEAKQTITCNLNLLPTTGTNNWSISGDRAADNSTLELRGTLTRTVPLQLSSTSTGAAGALGIWAVGAQGNGDINLSTNASLLFGSVQQTVTGKISLVGSGDRYLSAYVPVTLSGGLDIPTGTTLRFGYHNNVQHLIILNAPTTGTGNIDIFRGAVAISNLNQITSGNLSMGSANGATILDGVSWSDLMANRSGGWGATANKFQIGGLARFGARSAPLLIQSSGTDAGGTNTNTYFDRSFGLGTAHEKDGVLYANQPVTFDTDTKFTGCRDIWISGAGPGLTGAHGTGLVHTITADLSDGGPALRGGVRITAGANYANEVVLAGLNTWTGSNGTDAASIGATVTRHFCGLGGLMTTGNNLPLLTTFASPASLPTGNAGNTAYLSAVNRSGGVAGYLVTAAPGGATYDTAANLNWAFGSNIVAVLGSTGNVGDAATLAGSSVLIHSDLATGSQNLNLLVRGGTLNLGAAGNPLLFQPVTGNDVQATPITANQPATVYTDATGVRALIKRGTGTLVLANIAYTLVDGTGDTSGQFTWQIGSGTNAVYDGAVRVAPIGTGTNANSLENFNVQLIGGVLESSGTFSRTLGTGATQVQWPNNTAGGGFSAYGGDLTVDLNSAGADTFTWASTALFPRASAPLIFGSETANATVRWVDNINLNNAERTVWVMRGTGTAPEADIQGTLSHASGSLRKTGAGTLQLSGANSYGGTTTVAAGTLLVNGTHVGGGNYTVPAGATLGGTGTIDPATGARITVAGAAGNNAILAPGASIGTLTVGSGASPNNVLLGDNSTLLIETNLLGQSDLLVVNGTLDLSSNANRLLLAGAAPAGGAWYTIASYTTLAGNGFEEILWSEGMFFRQIEYAYGGSNIAVFVIPEPATGLALALAAAAALRRRRRTR